MVKGPRCLTKLDEYHRLFDLSFSNEEDKFFIHVQGKSAMSFFNNKHIITAMIVAPLLAIGSYYLVDLAVKEKPQSAVAGQAYPLVAKSNCRYTSGRCDLMNAGFTASLSVQGDGAQSVLTLLSNNALQTAMVGFVTAAGEEIAPVAMAAGESGGKSWTTKLNTLASADTTLRLVLSANGAQYFAETTMGFSQYQTSFDQDFRKND